MIESKDVNFHETIINGLRVLYIENKWFRMGILPDKGADLFELCYKPLDMELLLRTKRGLSLFENRDLKKQPLTNYNELYFGGWQDLIPHRAAVGNTTIHVENSNSACVCWEFEKVMEQGDITYVKCFAQLESIPLILERTYALYNKVPKMKLYDKVKNVGNEEIKISWTHHIAFGGNLIGNDSIINLPDCKAFNVCKYEKCSSGDLSEFLESLDNTTGEQDKKYNLKKPLDPLSMERIYVVLKDIEQAKASIKRRNFSLELSWDDKTFPYLRYWAESNENIYTIALEPSNSVFNSMDEGLEHGMFLTIKPLVEYQTWVQCTCKG